ncbi:MAG TPA: hypothetical protein VML19_08340 [Verrucomicrobiae bacterium]|nr:hypothetical protein [Verrucomicrobiae bacterium]
MQSLWIGPRLSAMERLCIRSFLAQGHAFHLFVYDEVANVPRGTILQDANAILDRSRIFTYTGNGSFAGFANMFRYKLLLERGGWWVDLDTVCLRPFAFDDECVLASELSRKGEIPANCILKCDAGSPFADYVWQACTAKDPTKLVWGETGPRLVAEAVRTLGLERHLKSAGAFCPVPFFEWGSLLRPAPQPVFGDDAFAVHLWHEMWRRAGMDKDANYPADCPFERLKSRYPES